MRAGQEEASRREGRRDAPATTIWVARVQAAEAVEWRSAPRTVARLLLLTASVASLPLQQRQRLASLAVLLVRVVNRLLGVCVCWPQGVHACRAARDVQVMGVGLQQREQASPT